MRGCNKCEGSTFVRYCTLFESTETNAESHEEQMTFHLYGRNATNRNMRVVKVTPHTALLIYSLVTFPLFSSYPSAFERFMHFVSQVTSLNRLSSSWVPNERPFQSTNPFDAAMRGNADHLVRELDKWHSSTMMSEGEVQKCVCVCVFMRLRGWGKCDGRVDVKLSGKRRSASLLEQLQQRNGCRNEQWQPFTRLFRGTLTIQ